LRIDAHHHLWHYSATEYGWIDESMERLRRDFLPAELSVLCAAAKVDATIAVQARQTLEETDWLLSLAEQSALIRGVVGWADIAAENFPHVLDELCARPLLKGLRHIVQGEPDGFLDAPLFNQGIATLGRKGLAYDILIFSRQLPEAMRFVDRHPQQVFVLDHIAKPRIAAGEIAQWSKEIQDLARRPNVYCKLSGMVTEANWSAWTPARLEPYFDVVLNAFGPSRLMVGSDWPVLNVASHYAEWWQVVADWLAPLTTDERTQIEGHTAACVYKLNDCLQSKA
jgi:L-fuconolactonase